MLDRLAAYRKGEGGSKTALLEELIRQEFFAHEKEIERYEKKKRGNK